VTGRLPSGSYQLALRTLADTFARQLEYAPVLAVTEAEDGGDPADTALLKQLHPTARRILIGSGGLAPAARGGSGGSGGFDVRAAAARQRLPHAFDGLHDPVTT
jgi:hypothetical protein